MTTRKIMRSMELRENLSRELEDVRFRDTEIIVMHYAEPVARIVKLTDEESKQIKIDMQNSKD